MARHLQSVGDMNKNEAFSRVIIDGLLADQGWNTADTNAVRYEVMLPDGTRADYVLCDRHGHSLAVIEAKRYVINPADAAEQAKAYARQLGTPYVFLTNGAEVLFWEWEREAYPMQKAFSERAATVRSIQSQQSATTAKAQATFDALLAQSFS